MVAMSLLDITLLAVCVGALTAGLVLLARAPRRSPAAMPPGRTVIARRARLVTIGVGAASAIAALLVATLLPNSKSQSLAAPATASAESSLDDATGSDLSQDDTGLAPPAQAPQAAPPGAGGVQSGGS